MEKRAMEKNDTPALAPEVTIEVLLAMRADGRALPTLTITTRSAQESSAIRYSHAVALWCAAYVELMLEKWGDHVWNVEAPRRVGYRRGCGYWQAKWAVYLGSAGGAEVEFDLVYLAIKALKDVAGTLGVVLETERQTGASGLH